MLVYSHTQTDTALTGTQPKTNKQVVSNPGVVGLTPGVSLEPSGATFLPFSTDLKVDIWCSFSASVCKAQTNMKTQVSTGTSIPLTITWTNILFRFPHLHVNLLKTRYKVPNFAKSKASHPRGGSYANQEHPFLPIVLELLLHKVDLRHKKIGHS